MKPLTSTKAEDPLEAEAWIKAIEAKFSAFVLSCSEEKKANFAALQLRGVLTPKFGKESDLWVRLDEESVWWKEGSFQRYSAKRSAVGICSSSAKEQ
jgi:hypothetical protein